MMRCLSNRMISTVLLIIYYLPAIDFRVRLLFLLLVRLFFFVALTQLSFALTFHSS